MLKKEDKDGIISFLRERLEKIQKLAEDNSIYYDNDDVYLARAFATIANIAEKTLNDTIW